MFLGKPFSVALFGHRDFSEHKMLDEHLPLILADLAEAHGLLDIYVGRHGEFDIYSASVIKHMQNNLGKENKQLICVFPYTPADIEQLEKYYDGIVICEKSHPKAAIAERNRWMVERADLIICYVERDSGGAYQAVRYAKRLGKKIINLFEYWHKQSGSV